MSDLESLILLRLALQCGHFLNNCSVCNLKENTISNVSGIRQLFVLLSLIMLKSSLS